MGIIEIALCIAGLYLAVKSVQMKKSGIIPAALVNRKVNLERAKDIPGYIDYMYPRGVVFGIFLFLTSAVLVYSEFFAVNPILLFVVNIVYVIILILFGVISVKAQNKFLFNGGNK